MTGRGLLVSGNTVNRVDLAVNASDDGMVPVVFIDVPETVLEPAFALLYSFL